MITSCSRPLSKKHLSSRDFEEIISYIPDAPKRSQFTLEEQEKIAQTPVVFQQWVYEILLLTKCAKENKCG